MKKLTYIAALTFGFFFSQNMVAQNAATSTMDRSDRHQQAQAAQQLEASKNEFQKMIFRFETAVEEKDAKSTKDLQQVLARMMRSTINWKNNNGMEVAKDVETKVTAFENYQFDFAATETKKEVEMKGIPSAFLKTLN